MEVKKKEKWESGRDGHEVMKKKNKQIKIKKKIEKEGGRVREGGTRSKKQKKEGNKRCGK